MNDRTLELLTSAHRGIGDLIAGREVLADDALAVDVLIAAAQQPREPDAATKELLAKSRAGDPVARETLREFGRLVVEEQSANLFKSVARRGRRFGGSFFV